MTGLFSCFARKPKKPSRPVPALSSCLKSHTSELSVATFRPEEADFEGFRQARPRQTRVVNRPLGEYQFPRVETLLEEQGDAST